MPVQTWRNTKPPAKTGKDVYKSHVLYFLCVKCVAMLIQALWSAAPAKVSSRGSGIATTNPCNGDDDAVCIRLGQIRGDPSIITINCPDQLGLASDLCRILFEFGLSIVRGDFSTDGKWCLIIFWVMPMQDPHRHLKWAMLKRRLLAACPSNRSALLFPSTTEQKQGDAYFLQIRSPDRTGLLNDMLQALWEMDLIINRMKSSISPDGNAINLFYITDNKKMLQNKKRQDDVCSRIRAASGDSSSSCDFRLAEPEWEKLDSLNSSVLTEELVNEVWKANKGSGGGHSPFEKVSVTVDNSLSPGHTLLQISCKDRRGLLYDLTRVLKSYNIQIAYGRFSTISKNADIDLFILQQDGKKIVCPQMQKTLCSRLEMEILHPIRVMLVNKGPDTELLVATPVEASGYGRPQAQFDVTLALRILNVAIFKADSERYTINDSQWDLYRFLLTDRPDMMLLRNDSRSQIAARIREIMSG